MEKKVRITKHYLTTPIKVTIVSTKHMADGVSGVGFAKTESGPFQQQVCRGSASWYTDKIGEEWEVLRFSPQFYRVNNNYGCGFFFIDVRDCNILP